VSKPKYRGKGGVYTHPGTGVRYWGVTSLTKAVDPDPGGLIEWSATGAAQAAIDTRAEWDPLDNPADSLQLIRGLARQRRGIAAKVGTAVHEAIEARVRADLAGVDRPSVPANLRPFIGSFDDFCDEYRPAWELLEATVFNDATGYAGTLDGLCEVPNVGTVLLDYKTGTIRVGAAAQLLLLNGCDTQLLDDGTEVAFPGADHLWAVQIRADGFTVHALKGDRGGDDGLAEALIRARTFGERPGGWNGWDELGGDDDG
jgi:hypothetical protein